MRSSRTRDMEHLNIGVKMMEKGVSFGKVTPLEALLFKEKALPTIKR